MESNSNPERPPAIFTAEQLSLLQSITQKKHASLVSRNTPTVIQPVYYNNMDMKQESIHTYNTQPKATKTETCESRTLEPTQSPVIPVIDTEMKQEIPIPYCATDRDDHVNEVEDPDVQADTPMQDSNDETTTSVAELDTKMININTNIVTNLASTESKEAALRRSIKTEAALGRLWIEEKNSNYQNARAHLTDKSTNETLPHHTLQCSVCRQLGVNLIRVKIPKSGSRGMSSNQRTAIEKNKNGELNNMDLNTNGIPMSKSNSDLDLYHESLTDTTTSNDMDLGFPGLDLPEDGVDDSTMPDTQYTPSQLESESVAADITRDVKEEEGVQEGTTNMNIDESERDNRGSDDSGSDIEEGSGYPKRYFRLRDKSIERCGVVCCTICNAATHTVCYGISIIDNARKFTCSRCREGLESVQCELCPNRGGIFKQTDDDKWVHVSCAIWVPRVLFEGWCDDNQLYATMDMREPITLQHVEKARWSLKCKVCKSKGSKGKKAPKRGKNACIQCCAGKCAVAFHVTCAQDSLPFFIKWDVFPATTSVEGYCMDNHVPGHYKKKRSEDVEILRPGTKVIGRYHGDVLWYPGVIEYSIPRRVCRLALHVDPGVLHDVKDEDLICIEEEADGDSIIKAGDHVEVAINKTVLSSSANQGRIPAGSRGIVHSVEEFVLYRIQFVDGYSTQCKRSDICTESEWKNNRPVGAKEGYLNLPSDNENDIDNSEISANFIIPRGKRTSALHAEVINKALVAGLDSVIIKEPTTHEPKYEDNVIINTAGKRPLALQDPTAPPIPAYAPTQMDQSQVKAFPQSSGVTKKVQVEGSGVTMVTPRKVQHKLTTGEEREGRKLVGISPTGREKQPKIEKKARVCGGEKCTNKPSRSSAYCSYQCAVQASETLFKNWIINRRTRREQAGLVD